jgi:hypothetical protein
MNNFLQKGIAQIQEATTADQAGDHPTAIDKYMQGLEYFNYAFKRERACLSAQQRTVSALQYTALCPALGCC